MKRLMRLTVVGVLALAGGIAVAWVAFPQSAAVALLKLNNMSAGLSEKTLTTEIGDIHYLEGGQGDTIVLVHGIFARKEHWVDLARHLVGDYHVIALDLPGFGDNPVLDDDEYLLGRQRDNLETVFDTLGLQYVHVAANSMGAYVSVLLAQDRPDLFATLSFIGSPLGVPTPIPSDMEIALQRGQIPLLAKTNEDFHARNEWLSPQMPYLPGPILKSWMASEVAMADKNERIWNVVHNQSDVLTMLEIAPHLNMDTLVIWCKPDRIFHVSGAEMLKETLLRAEMETLDNCGHLPMLDQPDNVVEIYLEFLKTTASN